MPQNLSRDTHFCVQRTHKQWQTMVLTDKAFMLHKHLLDGGRKKSRLLLNIFMCISRYLRTKTCLSIVIFFKFRYHWNGRMVFRYYFCALVRNTVSNPRVGGYLYDVQFPVRFITRSSQNSRLFK